MKVFAIDIPGICVIQPLVFSDDRGSFFESYQEEKYFKYKICYFRSG